MRIKDIDKNLFKQYTTIFHKEIQNYAHLPDVVNKILKFKNIQAGLIESTNDQLINFISEGTLNKSFRIILGSPILGDNIIFDNLDSLNNKTFSHLLDIIVGNGIFYLYATDKSKAEYYSENFLIFAIIFQHNIMRRLVNKIYTSSDKNEILNNITIVLAYSLYRFILGYQADMAKVKATDLLLNSELLKGSKFDSRVAISIAMNNLINTRSKDLYDALFNAGLLTEFKNTKNFIRTLATFYDIRLIKVLFTNPKFKTQNDTISYYVYKIIELIISDHLQEWNQYSKFKRQMDKEFRTALRVIESMLNDYSLKLSKLRI